MDQAIVANIAKEEVLLDVAIVACLQKLKSSEVVDARELHRRVSRRDTDYTCHVKPFMASHEQLIDEALIRLEAAKKIFKKVPENQFWESDGYRIRRHSDDHIYPVRNQVYTFKDLAGLYLRDQPCLEFRHEGTVGVIQDCDGDLSEVPGFNETKWSYVRETYEWIPIFRYVGEEPITNFVTIEVVKNLHGDGKDDIWACPIGFHRNP